jgi:signal peptidase II
MGWVFRPNSLRMVGRQTPYHPRDTHMNAVPSSRYVVFFSLAGIGCALDLATKHWAFASLGRPGGATRWVYEGICGFQTSLNHGALFGMGQGKVWLFAGLSMFAVVGIIYWLFVTGAARDRLLTAAMGSVMAGILGNLYDRLGFWSSALEPGGRDYAVRDWILFQYHQWTWPNFNLADSFLVCGVSLLVWQAFRSEARSADAEARSAGLSAEGAVKGRPTL